MNKLNISKHLVFNPKMSITANTISSEESRAEVYYSENKITLWLDLPHCAYASVNNLHSAKYICLKKNHLHLGTLQNRPCLFVKTVKEFQKLHNAYARFSHAVPSRDHITSHLFKDRTLSMRNSRCLKYASFLQSLSMSIKVNS